MSGKSWWRNPLAASLLLGVILKGVPQSLSEDLQWDGARVPHGLSVHTSLSFLSSSSKLTILTKCLWGSFLKEIPYTYITVLGSAFGEIQTRRVNRLYKFSYIQGYLYSVFKIEGELAGYRILNSQEKLF